jgi:energy-coupling factor transporter ATP-binding protein EcfA2
LSPAAGASASRQPALYTQPPFAARAECEQRGATIVYATHIFDGLENWVTHVAYLEDGEMRIGGWSGVGGGGGFWADEPARAGEANSNSLLNSKKK